MHVYILYRFIFIIFVFIKTNSQSENLDLHFYLNKISMYFSGSTVQVKSSGSSPHFEQHVGSSVIVWPE